MKRHLWTNWLIALIFLFGTTSAYAQPSYAKWGRMAVEETKKHYPRAQIIDYLHVGRTQVSPSTSKETFRLLLRQDHREFIVIVAITFLTASETLLSIQIQER